MSVSISIFQGGTQKCEALLRFLKSYPSLTGADSGIALIVGRRFMEIAELQDVGQGHVFSRHGRRAELLREDVSGRVSYLFLDVETLLSSVGDFPPFEILAFQSDVVTPLARVDALHFHFDLTRNEFDRIRNNAPARFLSSLTFEQHLAFPSSDDRGFFYLLDSIAFDNPAFPFSEAKNLSLELAVQIREWAEMKPCQYCRAVLLRGMPSGFCCRSFAEWIQDHLPHPLDESILRRIQLLSQSYPTFPRLLNRDLRPVVQNTQIQSPSCLA
jgi:hypothetical protein